MSNDAAWQRALENKRDLDRLERAAGNTNPVFAYTTRPEGRAAYEREAIARIVAPFAKAKPGISDADRATEYALQIELAHVTSLMGDVIRRVNENSSLVKIDERAWADFCADELPSEGVWSEKISNARRGY